MFVRFVSFRVRTFSDVVYIIPEHPCVARVTALWLSPSHIFDMVPKGESHGMLFLMALFCCASNDILVAQCNQAAAATMLAQLAEQQLTTAGTTSPSRATC